MLEYRLLRSFEYMSLRAIAKEMLIEAMHRYNGINNGDISLTYANLKPRGFNSNSQREKAIKELEKVGFLIKTKIGTQSPPKPNLYALTFLPLDECGGKLDLDGKAKCQLKNPNGLWRMTKKGLLTLRLENGVEKINLPVLP